MLVTLPCVLLLLDYWPLGRLGKDSKRVLGSACPGWRQRSCPCLSRWQRSSVVDDCGPVTGWSALRSWEVAAAGKLEWPTPSWPMGWVLRRCCGRWIWRVFYPHPGNSLAVRASGLSRLCCLVILSLGVWWQGRRSPLSGGGVALVSGNADSGQRSHVQVGEQAMADRYAYVPLMGSVHHSGLGDSRVGPDSALPQRMAAGAGSVPAGDIGPSHSSAVGLLANDP